MILIIIVLFFYIDNVGSYIFSYGGYSH